MVLDMKVKFDCCMKDDTFTSSFAYRMVLAACASYRIQIGHYAFIHRFILARCKYSP